MCNHCSRCWKHWRVYKKKELFYYTGCSIVIMTKWHVISALNCGKIMLNLELHNLFSTPGSSLLVILQLLESNHLEDMELAFLESFDTQLKLQVRGVL